tara:strand:+ start:381 stop:710 length:330 start_codon:yes stop_codon:yes gene_type:complete
MAELVYILEGMREKEYSDRKFTAAMKGVDLDKETGRKDKPKQPSTKKKASTFEDIQARVASGGLAKDADDILSLQGQYGARKGFQIGKDMEYAIVNDSDPNSPKSPMDF